MEQVDERQLAQLFEAAADDGPPASFGHADIVAASRSADRRRNAIAGGSLVAIAVLVGGVAVGNGLFDAQRGSDTSSAGSAAEPLSAPAQAQERAQDSLPAPASTQAGEPASPGDLSADGRRTGGVVPWPGLAEDDDTRVACGPPDRELADALAAELPAAAGAQVEFVPDRCPPQARAVAVAVTDVDALGWIYLVLGPVAGDGPPDRPVLRPADGAVGFQRLTPTGQLLVVLSVPAAVDGRAPFAGATERLAERIGMRF